MNLFLFRPHVANAAGKITTPDVVIDRLFVNGTARPLGTLTSDLWHQADVGETGKAAYAITALGGGALLSPAVVLGSGKVVVARSAWRLHTLDDRIGTVTLNGAPLADVGPPARSIEAAGGSGDTLPRGFMLVTTAAEGLEATLTDPRDGRSLTMTVTLEPVDADRWGTQRPKPRYSVGPTQKEVQHFI